MNKNTPAYFERINSFQRMDLSQFRDFSERGFNVLEFQVTLSGVYDPKYNLTPESMDDVVRDIISPDLEESYRVKFKDYIVYSVVNESFDSCPETTQSTGHLFRIYKESVFTDYVNRATFACDDYPGPLEFYKFNCSRHAVTVASASPPGINEIKEH